MGSNTAWYFGVVVLCSCGLTWAQPVNDLCNNPLILVDGISPIDTLGAATDGPPEPSCPFLPIDIQINQDVWYRYEASCTGELTVSLCGTSGPGEFDTKVAVYLGTTCPPAAEPLVCNDDDNICSPGNPLASFATVTVNRGQLYTIRVGAFQAEQGFGSIRLSCEPDLPECYEGIGDCCEVHANTGCEDPACCELVCDANAACCNTAWSAECANMAAEMCTACGGGDGENCDGCIPLRTGETYSGTTVGRSGSRLSRCDRPTISNYPDAWHCWRADCNGTAIVRMCDSEYDTTLGVFDRCGGLEVVCDDDSCTSPNTLASELRFLARAGNSYRFRVAGYEGDTGEYSIQVSCVPGPPNDRCENSIPILTGNTAFTTVDATTDGPPLPAFCNEDSGVLLGADVWYDFTPTCTGVATFSTCGTANYDTRLALYEGCGCPVTAARPVAGCNDDAVGCPLLTSDLRATVQAGTCYKLRVGGFRVGDISRFGSGTIRVTCGEAAPFDRCQDAVVQPLPHTFTGDNTNATDDCPAVDGDEAWLAFQIPEVSDVVLDYCGTTPPFDQVWLQLSRTCPCGGFTESAAGCFICPDTNAKLKWFCLPAGTYYYPVVGDAGSRGPYTIHVAAEPCTNNDACADALPLPDGDTLFQTDGMTTDGPPLLRACDVGGSQTSLTQDIWFDYTASCTGEAIFHTCDQVDFDTRLALYGGSTCPVNNDRLINCSDNSMECDELRSRLEAEVTEGETYKLRLGGPIGMTGLGCVHAECKPTVPNCPDGAVVVVDPPDGALDARQTQDPSGGNPMGIDRFIVQAPSGATASCFEACETAHPGLPSLFVVSAMPNGDGTYTVFLNRPLTSGAVTTLTYLGSSGVTASVTFHPANVNADPLVGTLDILKLVDCLNNGNLAGCGSLATDMDRSGTLGPFDLMRLMDLFNGAGVLESWNTTPRPSNSGVCP